MLLGVLGPRSLPGSQCPLQARLPAAVSQGDVCACSRCAVQPGSFRTCMHFQYLYGEICLKYCSYNDAEDSAEGRAAWFAVDGQATLTAAD